LQSHPILALILLGSVAKIGSSKPKGECLMKTKLLALATSLTLGAIGTSSYIASLSHPTELQQALANTTNTIALTGTAAIFGLLGDDEDEK
jgi:hypothetical protein